MHMNQDTNTDDKKVNTEVNEAEVQKEEVQQSGEGAETEKGTPEPVKST